MDEARLNPLGAALRRVPPLGGVLDARVAIRNARRRRAAAQREAEHAELDRAWLAALRGRTDLRINVGSSDAVLEGWVNVDVRRDPVRRAVRMDATQPWPFDSGSAEAVNSEHFLEHLPPEGARAYVREAFRVLRPGGVIRTSTPDLAGLCSAYADADPGVLDLHRSHGYTARDHADLVNNYAYGSGHRHLYDLASLAALLADAGFEHIERASFGRSSHAILRNVDRHSVGELESLVVCVDAVKPAGKWPT